jgi:hypothetical protein
MDIQGFYTLLAAACFTLVGLWWNVVSSRPHWTQDPGLKSLASGIYLAFLIPGVMSLMASLTGQSAFIWQVTFFIASVLGMVYTVRLMRESSAIKPGRFHASRWVVIVLYALILFLAIFPGVAIFLGLLPLQAEGLLLALLLLVSHGLAWELLTASSSASG